jgi:hypothetical protein
MAGNRAVVYHGAGTVSVESIDYPELMLKADRAYRRATPTVSAQTALRMQRRRVREADDGSFVGLQSSDGLSPRFGTCVV